MRQESKDNMLLRATEAAEELLKVRNNERLFVKCTSSTII